MTMLADAIAEIRSNGTTEQVDTTTGEIVPVFKYSETMSIPTSVRVDRCGVMFDKPLSTQEWYEASDTILSIAEASAWWVGDTLVYGEDHYGSEVSSQLYDAFSMDFIAAAMTTARAIPKHERRADVPYTHHRYVTKYSSEERAKHLLECAEQQFTVEAFRAYLTAYDAEAKGIEPPAPKGKADTQAALELCRTKEGSVWTPEDTQAIRFWLAL